MTTLVNGVEALLAIAAASTDYVGHLFGPSSLEMEDNLLRLDRTLADLFAHVDERVGLENTVIVLCADHGGPEVPGYLNELGVDARYVTPSTWDKAPGIEALERRFGVGEELIQSYFHPYVYLDRELLQRNGLDEAEVERAVAGELAKLDGVALTVSSTALREGALPNTPLIQSVLRNYNPNRSGDVFVVFEPHCFINDFDGLTVAATHGSPWTYDAFVPLAFAGGGIAAGQVMRRVEPVDIAPTLSALVGAKPPSGSRGALLHEVLSGR